MKRANNTCEFAFNRTKVELKSISLRIIPKAATAFNRTKVELKFTTQANAQPK